MKKISLFLILAISIVFAKTATAQRGALDLHLNVGFGFNAAPDYFESNTGSEYILVPYSLGSGVNADLGVSYMIGDHLGIGLDLSDIMGSSFEYNTIHGNTTSYHTYRGMMLAATPMLILSANTGPVNPYGHFGIIMGSASFTHSITESGFDPHSGTYIDVYSGGSAVGIYGAFGLQFALSHAIKLNLELYDRTISYAPTLVENTQAYNGEQRLNNVHYVDVIDNSSPSDTELKTYYPFSSVGFKVGVVFMLSGEKE